jgi:hypothetical protein
MQAYGLARASGASYEQMRQRGHIGVDGLGRDVQTNGHHERVGFWTPMTKNLLKTYGETVPVRHFKAQHVRMRDDVHPDGVNRQFESDVRLECYQL